MWLYYFAGYLFIGGVVGSSIFLISTKLLKKDISPISSCGSWGPDECSCLMFSTLIAWPLVLIVFGIYLIAKKILKGRVKKYE